MKKTWLLVCLVILAGCAQKETITASDPFLGGTTGLLINFLEDNPPSEVYDGGNFPFEVVVKLNNEGEWDVPADTVEVRVSGVDPAEFGLSQADVIKHPEEDLDRTSKDAEGNVNEGRITYVSFPGFNYKGAISGNIVFPIRADVCYTYGTKVMSKICVKRDLVDTSEDSLCKVAEEKIVYSSRAPIQITSLKEAVRGKDLIGFTLKMEHKGNGDVFQKGTNCDTTGILYENKIWVDVKTEVPGTKCTGLQEGTATSGYVTMYSGERTITCSMPASTSTDYEKSIEIELVYDYQEDITTQLLLKHTVD
ncbi:MAG: hypothetical protein ABIG95_06195 [Candidatus Woesearchaeota archaeon]